ncbi:MAG: leucine-rich repeat-containing protein kinase family protein, partial [Verrucomicrobiaceae bacterium]
MNTEQSLILICISLSPAHDEDLMMDTLSQLRAGKLAGATRLDLACELTEFPRAIFDLADSLEVLSLTNNRLSALPDDLGRLRKLRILFCSSNNFTHLTAELGECESLSMIGFKSNRIESVDECAFPPALRWLILTDNRIRKLPPSIGRCTGLQKLMLAGNQLDALPDEMAACENLELIRLAANQLRTLPEWLLALPRLSWLALAGNPCAKALEYHADVMTEIDWAHLELNQQLGEGASGVIHRATWRSESSDVLRPVAVKVFKGSVTSDGLPASEMAASLAAGAHPNLIKVLGRVANHPEQKYGLVMSLIDPEFRALAGPPDFDTCTRDLYADDRRFELPVLLHIMRGVASAAARLHAQGILHGDLYAHNVLW